MTFYRKAKFFIGFDCEAPDGSIRKVYDGELREWEVPAVEFIDANEAHNLSGTLKKWAEKSAKTIATNKAKGYCGEESFKATNIDWKYEDEEEWSDVSKEIIAAIKGYEKSAKVLIETTARLKAIPELVEDFIKRAAVLEQKGMDLRIKYNLVGIDL